jgi:hypothetical protein
MLLDFSTSAAFAAYISDRGFVSAIGLPPHILEKATRW